CVLAGLGLIAFPLDSQEAARQCGKLRLSRPLAAAILLALCCAFALLPMETFFYGDGGLLIPQIYLLSQGLEYDAGLLLNLKSSPLAGYLLVSTAEHAPDAYNLLGADLPETALYPFRWLSLIAFIPVGIMLLLEQDRKLALAQLLFVLGTAGSLFFFGYVEYYPLWFGLVTAFLLAGWQHMRSGKPLWLAVLWFVLAFAAHYATIALLPALLFIIFREHSFVTSLMADRKRLWLAAGSATAVLVAVYFIGGFHHSDSRIVMPLFPVESPAGTLSYTLLSWQHLWDIVNILLLLAPVQVFILLAFHRREFDPVSAMLIIAGVCFLGFLLFANTSLGLARDWDITAPLGVIISLLALQRLWRSEKSCTALIAGCLSCICTAVWVGMHLQPNIAAARFERIMPIHANMMYSDYAASGYEALRKFYRNTGNPEKTVALTKAKIDILNDPEDYLYLADTALRMSKEQPDSAIALQRWVLSRLTSHATSLNEGTASGRILDLPAIDSVAQVLAANSYMAQVYAPVEADHRALAAAIGREFPYPVIEGLQLYQAKQYDSAAAFLNRAIESGIYSSKLYLLTATSFALSRQYTRAIETLEEASIRYPQHPEIHKTLATWYIQAGLKPEQARRHLDVAMVYAPDDDFRRSVAILEQQLNQQQHEQQQ
ncbi:MAG: hypothetical protein CL946_13225, partial [Ectothiorhodospiraceae bacterium]|nr:hypothetical protein [Ectothiorhodospiraceae bacterium]